MLCNNLARSADLIIYCTTDTEKWKEPGRVDDRSMFRLACKAMSSNGVRVSPRQIDWDISGRCESPVTRDITLKKVGEYRRAMGWQDQAAWKRQSGVVRLIRPPKSKTLPLGFTVSMTVRCRKCKRCRNMRRMLWAERAKAELLTSPRTWFGTLTLHPDEQFRLLTVARDKMNRQGLDYDKLPMADQFRLRVAAASPHITNYLKRVRKECAAPLRYLWVSEAHQSGSPHFHALVHEVSPDSVVTHACLTGQWPHGFTKWKLVKSLESGLYLTKYLSKSTATRVRASVDYGKTSLDIAAIEGLQRDLQTSSADPKTYAVLDPQDPDGF